MVERFGNEALVQRTEILLEHGRVPIGTATPNSLRHWLARAVEEAGNEGDQAAQWAAVGDLGHFLERADRVQDAVDLWSQAFQDGSNDPVTVNRSDAPRAVEAVRQGCAGCSRWVTARPSRTLKTAQALTAL